MDDFHCMKECFKFLGRLISGSGFEGIVHKEGLGLPGNLNGVISGSHYNRCWTVHANFSEALERLQFQRFLKTGSEIESTVAHDLQNVVSIESKLENTMLTVNLNKPSGMQSIGRQASFRL